MISVDAETSPHARPVVLHPLEGPDSTSPCRLGYIGTESDDPPPFTSLNHLVACSATFRDSVSCASLLILSGILGRGRMERKEVECLKELLSALLRACV
jgi:hypothetical protein